MGENQEKNYRIKFLVGALIVLVAVACVAGGLLARSQMTVQKYNSYISAGNDYYTAGDYENAIAQYQAALKVDEGKESAYMNLSYSYQAIGDLESAEDIARQGFTLLQTTALSERVTTVGDLIAKYTVDTDSPSLSEDDIILLSASVTVENSILDMVAAYTYTDYYRDFGSTAAESNDDGGVSYYYEDIGMTVSYYNMDDEVVLNSSGTEPIATARACSVSFDSVAVIFDGDKDDFAVSSEKLTELLGSDISFWQGDDGEYYMTAEYKGCSLTVETDANGNIVSDTAKNYVEPLMRTGSDEGDGNTGTVSGYVKNATTGAGMFADIYVREKGSQTGAILDTLSASPDGSYTIEEEAGSYTVEVSADGFITEYQDIDVAEGQTQTGVNIVLSPSLATDEIRIVLTWGATPADLDSHSLGTSSSGNGFCVDYTSPDISGVGQLDVDDVNGYGPETTTITDGGCSFEFIVHDFRETGQLTQSDATVKLYIGDSLYATYTVPTSGSGYMWHVFSYDNGQVTTVNTINNSY